MMEIAWLDLADDAAAWREAGFVVEMAGDGTGICVVGSVEHRLLGAEADRGGIVGWGVTGISADVTEVDGIRTVVVDHHERRLPGDHPNGVFRIDHLVIRTNSTPRTVAALADLGLERRGGRTTNSAGDAVDMTFFWAGDTLLELAGPPLPEAEPKPSRLSGVAFSTTDLEAAAALLGERLTTPRAAVQAGRQIAALTKAAGCTTPVALMTPHVRTGGTS